jgi:cytochrome b pre-mRNA-processing protein 3
MLHMYLLTVRLRCFPASTSSIYQQHLIDHFFYDAEHRMVVSHNMEARGTRNKYLKDLFVQWRGILFAYDEGLVRGDAALASAVWRNVWKGREDVDVKGLAKVIAYMRKSLMDLEATEELEMQMGNWKWSDPDALKVLVGKKSPMIDQPFTEGTEAVGDAKSV